MKVNLHDVTPAAPGEPHGEEGPTHAGSVRVDYEYQAEMWVHDEIGPDHPQIMSVRCPALSRQWIRKGDTKKFEEVPWTSFVLPVEAVKAMSQLLAEGLPKTVEDTKAMIAALASNMPKE